VRRTSPHEPRLIGESADGEQRKQRLQSLQDKQTARAGEGDDSKSCQDLRQQSSTWQEQRREHRDDPGSLRF
jgi:hypothetical protein